MIDFDITVDLLHKDTKKRFAKAEFTSPKYAEAKALAEKFADKFGGTQAITGFYVSYNINDDEGQLKSSTTLFFLDKLP